MPRRLIIAILVVLILGIIGGTIVLILQRFRGSDEGTPTPSPATLSPADPGSQQVVNPTSDDDNDGLTNAQETLWGTTGTNPDTDGDGYKDGEEVVANHNPTIAAPNDSLPAGFTPGQNLEPLATSSEQVDQYFEDDLNLEPPRENLTEAFKQQYSPEERTAENMTAFVSSQPIITKLPRIKASADIKVSQASSPEALAAYAKTVTRLPNVVDALVMQQALDDLFNDNDPSTIFGLQSQVQLMQQTLIDTSVPASAVPLHQLALGYSEVLAATFEQIALYPEDPIKGLVGLHQLDTLDKQYRSLITGTAEQLAP